jgi:hypothetical protein
MSSISINRRKYDIGEARRDPGGTSARFTYGYESVQITSLAHLALLTKTHVWSPCLFAQGKRHKEEFVGAHWLALDFDTPDYSIDQAKRDWCDTTHLIGTSKSHQIPKGSSPACDRFRIIVPFDREIKTREEYEFNLKKLASRYGADENATDAARLFFPCVRFVSHEREGMSQPVVALPYDVAASRELEAINVKRIMKHGYTPKYPRLFMSTYITGTSRVIACWQFAKDMTLMGKSAEEIYDAIIKSPTYVRDVPSDAVCARIQKTIKYAQKAAQSLIQNMGSTNDETT